MSEIALRPSTAPRPPSLREEIVELVQRLDALLAGLPSADGQLAGFVMVSLATQEFGEPHLWRFLIDRMHQRRGIGARALELVIEQCRAWGDTSLLVSWIPGRGTPAPMYLSRGFVPTGVVDDGEIEARLQLGA